VYPNAHSSLITAFVSITENVPLACISSSSSSSSSTLFFLSAAAWFPHWRSTLLFSTPPPPTHYHHRLCPHAVFFKKIKNTKKRTTFSNGRIHLINASRFVRDDVVQEESADVEERLWHVGTEGLILERRRRRKDWEY